MKGAERSKEKARGGKEHWRGGGWEGEGAEALCRKTSHLGTLRQAWPGAGLQPMPSTSSQSQGMGASGRMSARFQEWTWQSAAGLSARADKPGCG